MKQKPLQNPRENKRLFSINEKTYLPRYPRVWTVSPRIANHYEKLYDVLATDYVAAYQLLNLFQFGLYCYLLTCARIGRPILVRAFADEQKVSHHTITAALDHLQDCELIDRVMRCDHPGRPIDLVMRPPLDRETLADGAADRIKENILIGKTRLLRRELGKDFPGTDNRFSERFVLHAIANAVIDRSTAAQINTLADLFHNACLYTNFLCYCEFDDNGRERLRKQPLSESAAKDYYLQQVFRWCTANRVVYSDDVVKAALDIRRHYGREPYKF